MHHMLRPCGGGGPTYSGKWFYGDGLSRMESSGIPLTAPSRLNIIRFYLRFYFPDILDSAELPWPRDTRPQREGCPRVFRYAQSTRCDRK